jgi:hypothetical protein
MISPIEILHRVRSFLTSSCSARESAAIKESENAREIATIKQSEIDAIRRVRAMIECG